MVGHLGIDAAYTGVVVADACVGRVVDAARTAGGEALIVADPARRADVHAATASRTAPR
jgi:bisphosphoglycerate-independent phosphoglycerate mutase (AlkP superfamily)